MGSTKFLKENIEEIKKTKSFKEFIESVGCNIFAYAGETPEYFSRSIFEDELSLLYDDFSVYVIDQATGEKRFWPYVTYRYQKAFIHFLIKKDKEEGRKYFEGLEEYVRNHEDEGKEVCDVIRKEIAVVNGLKNLDSVKFSKGKVEEFNKKLKLDKLMLATYRSLIGKQEEISQEKTRHKIF